MAYPLGLNGVVVGEGDTYEEALMDAKSAIAFHIETFVDQLLENPIEITALGFGMWAEASPDEDSVAYVNRIREKTNQPLPEVV